MSRIFFVLSGVFAATLAACSTTPKGSAVSIALPNGASSLALIVGATATFSVSEPGYADRFGAISANPNVAAVAPSAIQASSRNRSALSTGTGGASFTVTAMNDGTTQILVGDQLGNRSQFSVIVSPSAASGAVVLSPPSLAFTAAGAAHAQPVNASQVSYTGSFSATTAAPGQTNSCSGIASISPSSATAFTVTPVAAGHCTFTIAGGASQSATLTIDVTTTSVGGS